MRTSGTDRGDAPVAQDHQGLLGCPAFDAENREGPEAGGQRRLRHDAKPSGRAAPRGASFCLLFGHDSKCRSIAAASRPSLYIRGRLANVKFAALIAAAQRMETFFSGQDLLFTLLMKVGVAASLAALLVRWEIFRKVLYTEVRDSDLKLKLMLFLTPALALGVILRLVGLSLPLCRSDAGGFVPAGFAGRARGGAAGRLHGQPAGILPPRMAVDAHGRVCRLGGRL